MEKIKGVKKILGEFHLKLEHVDDPYITKISGTHTDKLIDRYAQQICQLFEPNPDESRMLTEVDLPWLYNFTAVRRNVDTILEMQQDLTASIKEAECQERVGRIFEEIETSLGIKSLDNEPIINRAIIIEWWQTLKKQEGVK